MKRALLAVVCVAFGLLSAKTGYAVPILQLYIEGAEYDATTDTWVATPSGSSGGEPFRLWAIGNVDGPGGAGTIHEVRLSVAYSIEHEDIEIVITPSRAGGADVGFYNGIVDPSEPIVPVFQAPVETSNGTDEDGLVTDGSTPVLGDGSPLPPHGVFGPGTIWREYFLGDFGDVDSPVGDFIGDFPTTLHPEAGQINVYEVSVIGGSGATLHFDLYNHVEAGNRAKHKFSPFSHDADGEANIIPEPASACTWMLLIGAAWMGYQRRKHASPLKNSL